MQLSNKCTAAALAGAWCVQLLFHCCALDSWLFWPAMVEAAAQHCMERLGGAAVRRQGLSCLSAVTCLQRAQVVSTLNRHIPRATGQEVSPHQQACAAAQCCTVQFPLGEVRAFLQVPAGCCNWRMQLMQATMSVLAQHMHRRNSCITAVQ